MQDATLWDAAIVGAGPAGCAAAYDLTAAGRRVVLLDRAAFPRPKACAGGLTMKAVRALRYPIEPVVRHWARGIVLEESAESRVTVGRGTPVCAMTVREELDSFCLDRTRERGAIFRRVTALSAIEQADEAVTLRFADGGVCRASYVLGADGVYSRVRALAGGSATGAWFRSGFALECNVPYVSLEERFPLTFDFAPVPGGYGWLFPRDNHVNVGLYVGDVAGATGLVDRAALDRYVAARCGPGRDATRAVGQFLGLGAAAYRPAAGTRILLAGDAAGFVDPLTGEGIYGAIRSGQAAAAAIHAALHAAIHGALGGAPAAARPREKSVTRGTPLADGFRIAAEPLQADLGIAEHAARRFYSDPARGFRLMRLPLAPRLVLRSYGEGFSLTRLLAGLRVAARFAS